MFGKIIKQQVSHQFNKAKDNQTINFLGNLDHGVRTFKQIYGVTAPVLESYGINPANKTTMKALTGYDTIKGHVMEGHDRVINDVNNIKNYFSEEKSEI